MAGLSEISREAITAIRAGELDAAGGFHLGISIIVLIGKLHLGAIFSKILTCGQHSRLNS